MQRALIVFSLLVAGGPTLAEPVALTGQALHDAVAGATVELDTPVGTKLPIKHAPDGTMSGDANGLGWYLGAATDTGRWSVKGDKLCQRWKKWFDGDPQCMTLRRDGRQIHWRRDDGKTGTATLLTPQAIVAQKSGAPAGLGLELPAAKLLEAEPAAPAPATAPVKTPARIAVPSIAPQPKTAATTGGATPAPQAPKPVFALAALAAPPQPTVRPVAPVPAAQPPVAPAATAVVIAPKTAPRGAAPTAAVPPARAQVKPAAVPAVLAFRVAGVPSSDVLNVRTGPSSEHVAVGALPPDARDVRVIGPCQQDWCPVEHGGIGGWVNSLYLAEDAPVRGSVGQTIPGPTPAAVALGRKPPTEDVSRSVPGGS